MNVKEIFISENENLIQKLIEEDIDFSDIELRKALATISAKVFNNKVGYIAFKDEDGTVYKVYIVPKIFNSSISHQELKKKFFQYMKKAFELVSKYGKKYYKELENYDTILLFHKRKGTFRNFEDILLFKYIRILENIYSYFQKHRAYRVKYEACNSQTLKYKLDLKRNIKELNKSKIHQIRKITLIYSKLAFITYQVLNTFQKTKLRILEEITQERLEHLVNKIKNLLRKKYKVVTSKNIKLRKLLSNNIKILFRKTEDKKLYSLLLSLLNEEIRTDNGNKNIILIPNIVTFFVSPEKIYELYVFDIILNRLRTKCVELQPLKKYQIIINNKDIKNKESNPDILIKTKKYLFLMDVKWKILKEIPSDEDILKLERDVKVWQEERKKTIPVLVFPKISSLVSKSKSKKIKLIFSNKDMFQFYVIQIDMSF